MKRLVLIRHAKSFWGDPDAPDIDRPLNARGRAAAPVTASWLAERDIHPDAVVTSPARRCVETWERMSPILGEPPAPQVEKALYMADPDTMLRVVHGLPDTVETAFLLGHQPGISSFARKLANGSVPASCQRAFTKFPTGSAAVIEFETADWADTAFGKGAFRSFAMPKELV